MRTRKRLHYTGRVQGVGFRYTTHRIAKSYDVCGYVQNLSDGRVVMEVEGFVREVDDFIDAVAQALERNIESVQVESLTAKHRWTNFEIQY